MNTSKIKPICLLHNTRGCTKANAIENVKCDNKVRVIVSYDWGTQSGSMALIRNKIKEIFDEMKQEFPGVKFLLQDLRGKDGSIYCDICRQIRSADVALFELSTYNLNVVIELGLAINAGDYVLILRSAHYTLKPEILSDLQGILEYRYSNRGGILKFQANFVRTLKAKLRFTARRKSKLQQSTGSNQ